MAEPFEDLKRDDVLKIEETLLEWAQRSDERVVLELVDGTEISNRDIAEAVEARDGRIYFHLLNLMAVGAETERLESILADFAEG